MYKFLYKSVPFIISYTEFCINIICVVRLKKHFMEGKSTDKLAVTVIIHFLCNIGGKLTREECGKIVKRIPQSIQKKL